MIAAGVVDALADFEGVAGDVVYCGDGQHGLGVALDGAAGDQDVWSAGHLSCVKERDTSNRT